MPGGHSGETFRVGAAGEHAVLRLHVRDPGRAAVDAAVLDLVRGVVPAPRVLEVRTPQMGDGPAFVLTELLPGRPLSQVLPAADERLRDALGASVGVVLARLSGIPFRRGGDLVDVTLVPREHEAGPDTLVSWVEQHLDQGPLARWAASDREGLRAVADDADALLGDPSGPTRWCLVHGDLDAANVLVDPAAATVTGVVDWERAHAGHPYTDLGALLRHARDPAFADRVVEVLVDRAPDLPGDLLDRARSADLWSLVELASRAGANPVADRAHDLLRAVSRERDVHARG